MKEKKETNIYKVTTFILIAIILIIGITYVFGAYKENIKANHELEILDIINQTGTFSINKGGEEFLITSAQAYERGKVDTVNEILSFLEETGQVTFFIGEDNLSLVPAQYINFAQEQMILEIIQIAQQDGQVVLRNNETEIVLNLN